jgi:hypothetical protein
MLRPVLFGSLHLVLVPLVPCCLLDSLLDTCSEEPVSLAVKTVVNTVGGNAGQG